MDDYGVVTALDTVRIERVLPGPIERLWTYLTDAEKRGLWLSSGPMELRPGGSVQHRFRNSELTGHDGTPPEKYAQHACESMHGGTMIECQPPTLLHYTWGGSEDPSEVRFELSPRGAEVLLVVTHTRLATRGEMISVASGWHTHLEILAARLRGATPPGFWPTHTRLETEYDARIPQQAGRRGEVRS